MLVLHSVNSSRGPFISDRDDVKENRSKEMVMLSVQFGSLDEGEIVVRSNFFLGSAGSHVQCSEYL